MFVLASAWIHGGLTLIWSGCRLLFLARLKEVQDAIGTCADEEEDQPHVLPDHVGMSWDERARESQGERRSEGREAVLSARTEDSGRWAHRSTRTAAGIMHHSLRQPVPPPVPVPDHRIRVDDAFDVHVLRAGIETDTGSSSLAMSLNVLIGMCV